MIETARMPSGSGKGATLAVTDSFNAALATSAIRAGSGRASSGSVKIVPITTWPLTGECSMYVLRWQLESLDSCESWYSTKPLGPSRPTGSIVIFASGHFASDRDAKLVRAPLSVGARCARTQKGMRASTVAVSARFIINSYRTGFKSLRVNSAVAAFNPFLDAAVDVHDVAEAGHAQQLRRHRSLLAGLAINEHGLVLIRQQFGQPHLDGLERRADRPRNVSLGTAICGRWPDVDDHNLLAVENHLRGDGRRDLRVAAAGPRHADRTASAKQKAEGRR